MRRLLVSISIGISLLLLWVAVRTVNHLEAEIASLRLQVAARNGSQGPQASKISKRKSGDAAEPPNLSLGPDVSIEPTLSVEKSFERISFSAGKMELQSEGSKPTVRVVARPNGDGSFQVLNQNGQEVAYLGTKTDGHGLLELDHHKDGTAVELASGSSGGYAWFKNSEFKNAAFLGSSGQNDGLLQLFNLESKRVVSLGADKNGYAWFSNYLGSDVVYLGSSTENTGLVQLYSADKRLSVLTAVQPSGGYSKFFNNSGKEVVHIGADTAGYGALFINEVRARDYAEVFELATRKNVIPGTVMAVTAGSGITVSPASAPYEQRVVGVISGAGSLQSGTVIGARDDGSRDLPIAVSGQVYVRICSEAGPIEPGDLLVASSRPGVAMKAMKSERAVGAVIGKALESFRRSDEEEGLIRMLVILR